MLPLSVLLRHEHPHEVNTMFQTMSNSPIILHQLLISKMFTIHEGRVLLLKNNEKGMEMATHEKKQHFMFLTRPSAYGQDFLKLLIEKKIVLRDICPCLQAEGN